MASTKPPAANAAGGAQGPLVEELRSQAMAHLGAAPEPPPKRQRTTTLVPVMVNIDRDEGDIRENFLWHIGETGYDPRPVAMRLAADLQLPQAMVKTIEDEIGRCLKGFKSWKDLGGPKVVRLQRGELVFRDEVDWDAGDPRGAAAVMAYATEVCRDLGLDLGWHTAITQHLSELVHDVVEDLRKRPELVTLVPPPTSIWRGMPPASLSSLPPASSSDPASLSSLPPAPSLALVAAALPDDNGPLVLSSKPEPVSRRPLFRPRLEHYDPTFDLEAQRRACREARKHGHGHHQGHGHGHGHPHHSHQRPHGDAQGVKVEPQAQAPGQPQAQAPGVIKPEPQADRPMGLPTDPHVAPRVKPEPQGANTGPGPGLGMAPGPPPGLPQAAGEVHVKREPGVGSGHMQLQVPTQPFGVQPQQQQGMAPGWPQQQQQHPQFPG